MSTCSICKKELIKNPEPRPIEYHYGFYRTHVCTDEGLAYHRQARDLTNFIYKCPSNEVRRTIQAELETILRTRMPSIENY